MDRVAIKNRAKEMIRGNKWYNRQCVMRDYMKMGSMGSDF